MKSNYTIEIKFLSLREIPQVNKMKFNKKIYEVKKDTVQKIEIPLSFFEEDESQISSLKLLNNSYLINECILEIFKGSNYFYCFLDEKGYTIQLLFLEIQPKIRIPLYGDKYFDITNSDTNNTLNRKRFSLVNANLFSILIDNEYFTIPSFAPDIKSYQFSVYDIKKN